MRFSIKRNKAVAQAGGRVGMSKYQIRQVYMSIAAKQTLCPGMLPDIQSTKGDGEGESLSWVGMEQIDLPIDIAGRPVSAKVNAGINLLSSPEAEKGIHMSRLYLLLDELTQGKSHRHYCNMC